MNQSRSNLSAYFPLFLAGMLVLGIYIGSLLGGDNQGHRFVMAGDESSNKISQVLDMIDNRYVDPVEKEELVDAVLDDLLQQLDPHSDYITRAEFQELQAPLNGEFEGIGVEFQIQRDTVVVIDPIDGGPSETAGILAGDRFLKAEDVQLHGSKVTNKLVQSTLRGPKRSKVQVEVYRPSTRETLDITITRGTIPINSVTGAFMLSDDVGYIKLVRFAETSAEEFDEAAENLRAKGMKKLVFDLRGNGGGYLHIAEYLADQFLETDRLIVYTEGKNYPRRNTYSKGGGKLEDVELVVLIDEGSASASEVLAGALQDNDRATIVGRRSFGKGLVQDQAELLDQSFVRLTTARYYTPSGRSIQKPYGEGIDYNAEFSERQTTGELLAADSIEQDTSQLFKTAGGRIVYGGGGITPDVFVPIDTSGGSYFLTELFYTGVLRQFTFNKADKSRKEFERYEDIDSFKNNYKLPSSMIEELIAFAKEKGLSVDRADVEKSKQQLELRLRANIARNVFGSDAYIPIITENDPMKRKAMELLGGQ